MRHGFLAGLAVYAVLAATGPEAAAQTLRLRLADPSDTCSLPGEPITVILSMADLPLPASGYQAFMGFDPQVLGFVSGTYILPAPFGLPVIFPITAQNGTIDAAAGVNVFIGQQPTAADADLVVLTFTALPTQGRSRVFFRSNDPVTRLSLAGGGALLPLLIDTPRISVGADLGDGDGDGVRNPCDNCPSEGNADQADADDDGVGDACDLCPQTVPYATVDADGCPPLIPPDFDRDGDVDAADLDHQRDCAGRPAVPLTDPLCLDTDFDLDGDNDQADFAVFQRCTSGEDLPANPACFQP